MRVLSISTTYPRFSDDTQRSFVHDLNRHLVKGEGLEVIALVPHAPGLARKEILDEVAVERFRYAPDWMQHVFYGAGTIPNLKSSWRARAALPLALVAMRQAICRAVAGLSPDVIHVHWLVPQGYFAVNCARRRSVPTVVTAHGSDVRSLGPGLLRRWLRRVILEADLTVANTPDTARQVCEVATPKRLEIIPEGVDPGVFNPQQNSSETRKHLEIRGPWILGIGRLIEWKGFRYLIEAMPKILGQHPDAHLTIGGDGPEMSDLRSLVNELGLGAHVSLPGALTRGTVARYMASADVFVGPSIRDSEGNTEGQGAVFVEAMASGCPAIGTRVGGIPDVIQDGHNGLLVPQRDPLALADAVLRVLGDEEGSRAMAERGMETSRLYSFSEIAKTYSALFRDLRRRGPATVVS